MSWDIGDARRLLHAAFPWKAHVTVEGGSEFVSIRYDVLDEHFTDSTAMLRLERDPSDTLQPVTRVQLERAAASGVIDLDSGAVIRQPEPADLHLLASPFRDLIGYQSPGDPKWVARMRLHQSWWRTFRLRVPFGRGPQKGSANRYGNMLDEDAAGAGMNFLTRQARAAYQERVAATTVGVDTWRTSRNLLASQPMAFNVFGHLSKHLDLATGLFRSILGPDEVGELTGIDIERLSPALRDRTAFDAFATYQRPDGTPGCVAVETKLTEKFSQQPYNWETYLNHPAFDPAVWTTTDPNVLGDKRWSQLWRNHLLARAATTTNPDLGTASVLVVHHPQDPHCADAVAGYRRLLTDPDTVQPVDLMEIRAALGELVEGDPDQEAWLADLYDRYLNLRLSDGLVGLDDLAP